MTENPERDYIKISDEELMLSFKNGNEKAFDELVKRYMEDVLNYLYKFTGDYNESDDIAQESFIRLFSYKDKYNENMKFSSWFYTIVINRAKTRMGLKTSRDYVSLDEMNEEELSGMEFYTDPSDEDELEESEYHKEIKLEYIKQAFDKMDYDYREVIFLRFDYEFDYEKIAKILDVPVGTVKSRINRGRAQLKEILKNDYNV